MKIKVEDYGFSASGQKEVKIQVTTDGKWIDFGVMNYTERKELAGQLRSMARELLEVK